MNWMEERARYRPDVIRVLFVGESPPFGGTFFYSESHPSGLRRETERVFREAVGTAGDFLKSFRQLGCFLDDLCLDPVNQLKAKAHKAELKAAHVAGIEPLAQRIREADPLALVIVGIEVAPHVKEAAHRAGFQGTCYPAVPFPLWHVRRFRDELAGIVETLFQAGTLDRAKLHSGGQG